MIFISKENVYAIIIEELENVKEEFKNAVDEFVETGEASVIERAKECANYENSLKRLCKRIRCALGDNLFDEICPSRETVLYKMLYLNKIEYISKGTRFEGMHCPVSRLKSWTDDYCVGNISLEKFVEKVHNTYRFIRGSH